MTTEYSCVTVVPQLVTRLFHGYGTTVLLTVVQLFQTLWLFHEKDTRSYVIHSIHACIYKE